MTVNLVTVERAIPLEKKSMAIESSLTHALDSFKELAKKARFFVMDKNIKVAIS